MQCLDARSLLPLHAYDDVTGPEKVELEQHLAECPACQQELAVYRRLRQELSTQPLAAGTVDVPRIYQAQALRWRRRSRLYQWAGSVAVAACFLVLFTRLEVQVNGQQMTLRWGRSEAPPVENKQVAGPVIETRPAVPEAPKELVERIRVMNDLIYALADTIESSDRSRHDEMQQLRRDLAALQQRTDLQFVETQHDMNALYTAQFGGRSGEAKP
jgi:hypothetical protein